MRKILLLSTDPITEKIAGIATRYLHLATQLAKKGEVILGAPEIRSNLPPPIQPWDGKTFRGLEVILAPPLALLSYPSLLEVPSYLIFDLSDPVIFENLYLFPGDALRFTAYFSLYQLALWSGDHFLVANVRQRDFYMPLFLSSRRANTQLLSSQPDIQQRLFTLLAGGTPDVPFPISNEKKEYILWFGGIWEWMDPLTPLRAFLSIQEKIPYSLVLVGSQHPSGYLPPSRILKTLWREARASPLWDRRIRVVDWVPYEQRVEFLKKAFVGVSCHPDGLEAYYAHRARLFEYLWAGIPVIATSGETLGEEIASHGAGILVKPGDVQGVARALLDLHQNSLRREEMAKASRTLGEQMRWEKMIHPLQVRLESARKEWFTFPHRILYRKYREVQKLFRQISAPSHRVATVLQREGWGGIWNRLRQRLK